MKQDQIISKVDPMRRLNQLKWTALSLLIFGGITLLVSVIAGGQGAWSWIRAFAEAAIVGGLADWFAVSALFRKPLGLPIPHTAIIPRSKDRIADGLANFVEEHFLTSAVLLEKIQAFDPASRLASFMESPDRVAQSAEVVRGWLLEGADWMDDPVIRDRIVSILRDTIEKWDAASTAGEVLGVLTQDGRHQELLNTVLEQVGGVLGSKQVKDWVSQKMLTMARSEWPWIIKTIDAVKSVDGIAEKMAENLGDTLIKELENILGNPKHELREKFDRQVIDFTQRLKEDTKFSAYIQQLKSDLLQSNALNEYTAKIFQKLMPLARSQLESGDTALMRNVKSCIAKLGERIGNDPALKASINKHILLSAEKLVGDLQGSITSHISQTIKAWDERQLVETLELNVGSDLQFIRLNGTLVGGGIGMLLHAALIWIPPLG